MAERTCLPYGAPGRLTGRWINMLGGLVVMSMYMENAVGWNELNRALAKQLAAVVAVLRCFWVVALDGGTY